MADYIKRDSVLQIISDAPRFYLNDMIRADAMRDCVKRLLAADVRENVRGRWIEYNGLVSDLLVCSECERYFIGSGDEYDYNFCPNCGADMRGETDDSN